MALSQERAEHRAKYIQKGTIHYHFHVYLQKGQTYSGYAEVTFNLIHIPDELVLDFKGSKILGLVQNNQNTEVKHIGGFIYLQPSKLKVGTNSIGVHYENRFDNDGSGCISFVDTDQKQYISTQFAPYYANRVFPCFDQPDLKARMNLSIICPLDWKKVLSNQHARVEKQLSPQQYLVEAKPSFPSELASYLDGKQGKMTLFPSTKILSTYLFCFLAGQYVQLRLEEQKQYKGIPMSLFCIESLFPTLVKQAPFIFEITIESMKFYQQFFNYPYAFGKYDQIFAHEYKWGGMENAGAVVYKDTCLFREKVSEQRMFYLANTISHELSHHWFGNLVTMRWWDDLWLNETFATFISYLCLEKVKGSIKTISYQSAWPAFFQAKGRGYLHDQMVTTHPIRGPIANTNVADSIFDGITYSKGAAAMKQFCYMMGEQNFGKALESYFRKYEWGNATIDDFLAEMQKMLKLEGFTLEEWKVMWLEKASLNILQPRWDPQNLSAQAKLIIKQSWSAPNYPTLRYHKIKVAMFLENCQADILEVLVSPCEETAVEYDGSKGYKAVLLNYEDHTFAKIAIDPTSLEFFMGKITVIQQTLSRELIWNSLYEMIRDAQITSHQFVSTVTSSLAEEPADNIVEKVLDDIFMAIAVYTPERLRGELNDTMFNFLYGLLTKIPEKEENRITIVKSKIVNFASSEENILRLIRWMRGKDQLLEGVKMTGILKWETMVQAFSLKTLSVEEKQSLFSSVSTSKGDLANKYRFLCDGLKSSGEEFEKIYQLLKERDGAYSVSFKEYIARGWNHPCHRERLGKYRERYFADVQELAEVLRGDHFQLFYEKLAPIDDDLEYLVAKYQALKFPEGMEKHAIDILKMIDELKRRQRAYALYQQ